MSQRRTRSALTAVVLAVGLGTGPGPAAAQSESPAASAAPSPTTTATPADPAADLWLIRGQTLVRVDGITGEQVEQRSIADPACPIPAERIGFQRPADGVIVTTGGGETPSCFLRIPLDGSAATSFPVKLPPSNRLMIDRTVDVGGTIWVEATTVSKDGSSGIDDANLYRLDTTTGELTKVLPQSSGLDVVDGVIGTVHSAKKGQKAKYLASTVDPASGTATPIPDAKPMVPSMSSGVHAGGGRLTYTSSWGGKIYAYDVATGTTESVPLPKKMEILFGGLASPDGLYYAYYWQQKLKERFQPWAGGDALAVPDPCADHPFDGCTAYVVNLTPGGIWKLAGLYTQEGTYDWEHATLYRYDATTMAETAAIDGRLLALGPDAGPAPSIAPVLTSACADTAVVSSAATGFCVTDLIAAGAEPANAKAALKAAGNDFRHSGCVGPAGGDAQDRGLLCLEEIGYAWRGRQRDAELAGRVTQEGLDAILPMYQWAAATLSSAEKAYLDTGLAQLDQWPLDLVREVPTGLKDPSVLRQPPVKAVDSKAIHRLLREAWLDTGLVPIPDPLVPSSQGGYQPDLPSGFAGPGSATGGLSYYLGNHGGRVPLASAVSKCELAIGLEKKGKVSESLRTETCAVATAPVWLLYEATGDERFIDVALAIRDLELRAEGLSGADAAKSRKAGLYFDTLECWLTPGGKGQGCYSGL